MPFVQTGDISSSECYLNSYSQTLNDAGVNVSKVFEKNAILMTIAANIGDSAITQFAVACPDSVVGIQPYTDKANVVWLKYTLDTFKESLSNQAGKNAQKNINLQVLKPLAIPTPPLAEQKKIAEILSTWDEAISVVGKQLENCRQQKKALMQQLLTGKKRLPGFGGEWKNTTIGEVFSFHRTLSNSRDELCASGDYSYIHYGDIHKSFSSHWDCSKESLPEISATLVKNTFFVEEGDLIIADASEDYEGIGKAIEIIKKHQKPVVSGLHTMLLRPVKGIFAHCFAGYLIQGVDVKKQFRKIATGVSVFSLSKGELSQVEIKIPPVEEQKAISEILFSLDKEIGILHKKLMLLQSEKQALMQQLLTGKKRVAV